MRKAFVNFKSNKQNKMSESKWEMCRRQKRKIQKLTNAYEYTHTKGMRTAQLPTAKNKHAESEKEREREEARKLKLHKENIYLYFPRLLSQMSVLNQRLFSLLILFRRRKRILYLFCQRCYLLENHVLSLFIMLFL